MEKNDEQNQIGEDNIKEAFEIFKDNKIDRIYEEQISYIIWAYLFQEKKLKKLFLMMLFKQYKSDQESKEEQNEENGLSFTFEQSNEFIQDCIQNPKYKMPNKFEILSYFKVIDKENNNFLNTKNLFELLTKKTDEIQNPLTREELKNFVQFNSLKKNKDNFYYDDYCQDTDLFFQQHKKQNLMQLKPQQLNKLKDIQKRGKKMKIKQE